MFEWFPHWNQNCYEQKICQNKKRQPKRLSRWKKEHQKLETNFTNMAPAIGTISPAWTKNVIFHENYNTPRYRTTQGNPPVRQLWKESRKIVCW